MPTRAVKTLVDFFLEPFQSFLRVFSEKDRTRGREDVRSEAALQKW